MENVKKEGFRVIGLATRTINGKGKSDQDIPSLWNKFMQEEPGKQLPEKLSDEIYCVYYEYEGDYLQPYTVLIGYKVPAETILPKGMSACDIPKSNYSVFKAEGDLTGIAVYNTWISIWESPIKRTYKADFEVYGSEAIDPKNGKINIFVGID